MKATVVWKDAMVFEGQADIHQVPMDAKPPFGKNGAPSPKQLLTMGLGGCTAMDVMGLLKKYKQIPQSFEIELDMTSIEGKQPVVFEKAVLSYVVTGEVAPEKLLEAVKLSQTKYCSVSAMLSKAFPISYRVVLNGAEIGTGISEFN
jgi:putative redox protein